MATSNTSMNTRSRTKKQSEIANKDAKKSKVPRVERAPHDDLVHYDSAASDDDNKSVGNKPTILLNQEEAANIKSTVDSQFRRGAKPSIEDVYVSVNAGEEELKKQIEDQLAAGADLVNEEEGMNIDQPKLTDEQEDQEDAEELEENSGDNMKKEDKGKKTEGMMLRAKTRKYILKLNRSLKELTTDDEEHITNVALSYLESVKEKIDEDKAQELLIRKSLAAVLKMAEDDYHYEIADHEMSILVDFGIRSGETNMKIFFYYLEGIRKGEDIALLKHSQNLEKLVERFNAQSKKLDEQIYTIHKAADVLNASSTRLKLLEESKGKKSESREQPSTVPVPKKDQAKEDKKLLGDAIASGKKAGKKSGKSPLFPGLSSDEDEDIPVDKKKKGKVNPISQPIVYDDLPNDWEDKEVGEGSKPKKVIVKKPKVETAKDDMDVDVVLEIPFENWTFNDFLGAMQVTNREIQAFYTKEGLMFDEDEVLNLCQAKSKAEWIEATVAPRSRQGLRSRIMYEVTNKVSLKKKAARKKALEEERNKNL